MIRKSLFLTSVIVFCHLVIFGQNISSYDWEWKIIDSLVNIKNLPKSALVEVHKVLSAAKRESNEPQWIKALIYENYLESIDDNRDINIEISSLENEISKSPPRVSAILKSIEAELLNQYLQNYRYRIRNRTTISADTSSDITSWTISHLHKEIRKFYIGSLDLSPVLRKTSLDFFDPVLLPGNSREQRPSLYDLLAYRALDYFSTDLPDQEVRAEDSLMYNVQLFSDAPFFVVYDFSGKDSSSNQSMAIKIYQQLLRFHAKDVRLDAWISADIGRIHYINQFARMDRKDSLYLNALNRITNRNPTLSVVSQAWYLQAQWWANQAELYKPNEDSLHRYDYLQALAFCKQGIQRADSSEGKSNCELLFRQIHSKTISLNLDAVNIPKLPFRMLVGYKNVNRIYSRIIRITDLNRKLFSGYPRDKDYWHAVLSQHSIRNFAQNIPETGDYQMHRVEVKLDALESGEYVLITSTDEPFSDSAVLGLVQFACSNIAFVQNETDYFVLDRNSGQPLINARAKITFTGYGNQDKNTLPVNDYKTDEHGHFRVKEPTNSGNYRMEIYNGKDFLSTAINYYYYRNSQSDDDGDQKQFEKNKLKDFLFTDRSIYRPGQTIYFKGLLITRDFITKKPKPAAPIKITIFLKDVNDQTVDSVSLKSNEFGSVSGNFQIPSGILGGEFSIQDDITEDVQYVSVEEYKRPVFYVEFDTLKNGYRLNDTLKISGEARAFAGNAIDGAIVKYRIYRIARFPYPWLYKFNSNSRETEIGHGTDTLDSAGKFRFQFRAIPDVTVDPKTLPIFQYRIQADVTDAAGETRTINQTVSAGYRSFQIICPLPLQSRLEGDSLSSLSVTTQNTAGMFVEKKLTLSVFALENPQRLIRERYWAAPDQFVITKDAYLRLFPSDEYSNETDPASWKIGTAVYNTTSETRADGYFQLNKKIFETLPPGIYLFQFESGDTTEKITDKRYIEITSSVKKSTYYTYNRIPFQNLTAEPGNAVQLETGSDASDIFVIRARKGANTKDQTYSYYTLHRQINDSKIDITETDRGGLSLNDVFIVNNRWYTSLHYIRVPWTNKELSISYQTWKDKTQPGSAEKWSVHIRGNKTDKVNAEILTSMYDASLDQFRDHAWVTPDIYPVLSPSGGWVANENFKSKYSDIRPEALDISNYYYQTRPDELFHFGSGNGEYAKLSGRVSGLSIQSNAMAPASELRDVTLGYGAGKKNKEGSMDSVRTENSNVNPQGNEVKVRKNFNETAFFKPDLKTDAFGNLDISFTMPEALTRWKWMTFANTKDLAFGYSEKEIVTQKELMVQPNMPRFFREGDTVTIAVKVVNLSNQEMRGSLLLDWMYADNNSMANIDLGNINKTQSFTIAASRSAVYYFPLIIPPHFTRPVLYKVIAQSTSKGEEYSDGEENIIPVLSNRLLVTESLPLNMNGQTQKQFEFSKLLNTKPGGSLQNQSLTLEYTTNPVWYALQTLPYLMEFPYECAEQTFNRFYANSMATHLVQVTPALLDIFEKWKNIDTAALLSNLLKNEELKTVLIRETPWVLQAQSESQQKKNIALLFDLIKMQKNLASALSKLEQLQFETGAFPWFKGGRDDRFITQYILTGFGKLEKLQAVSPGLKNRSGKIVARALEYLDGEICKDYSNRNREIKGLADVQIQYLYMRSFFPDYPVSKKADSAMRFYWKVSSENWMKQPVFMQGMIALVLKRMGDVKSARDILASLRETATVSNELGMYWKSVNYGYSWQQAPVETQALLINLFQELNGDVRDIEQMKFWLLQKKRTSHWATTIATADACYALLANGMNLVTMQQNVSVQLGNIMVNSSDQKTDAGTGYFKKQFPGDSVSSGMGNISVRLIDQNSSATAGETHLITSWGAVYWQYFENLDLITPATTQLSLQKEIFLEKNSDKGPVLEMVSEKNPLRPGDRLKIRITIKADRDLEYVHLKDMRASCLEPADVISEYRWQGGLGYYQTTQDASTSFFFDRIPKGSYVFEYPVFVTSAGSYSNGISVLECMYSPEFAAHSGGIRIQVTSK